MRVYIDTADWWIGLYRGPHRYYVCLLPCVVIRWDRRELRHLKRRFREAMATGEVRVLRDEEPLAAALVPPGPGDGQQEQGAGEDGTQHEQGPSSQG